jgi:hypothetical protein
MKLLLALLMTITAQTSFGKTMRATEISTNLIQELLILQDGDYIIDFRAGDKIDLQFTAQGDLLESKNNPANILTIKKNFNLKITNSNVFLSINGNAYKKLKELVKGQLNLGTDMMSSSQTPGIIQAMLSIYLK